MRKLWKCMLFTYRHTCYLLSLLFQCILYLMFTLWASFCVCALKKGIISSIGLKAGWRWVFCSLNLEKINERQVLFSFCKLFNWAFNNAIHVCWACSVCFARIIISRKLGEITMAKCAANTFINVNFNRQMFGGIQSEYFIGSKRLWKVHKKIKIHKKSFSVSVCVSFNS